MTTGRLFVSFWELSLENLPEGRFARRLISPDEARALIAQARKGQALSCASCTDLMAPYHQKERDNHAQLCRALEDNCQIVLSMEDFCSNSAEDEDGLYFINPLNCVRVQGPDRLMIVTCAYAFAPQSDLDENLHFEIAPDTIKFHVIEAAG